MRLKISLNPRSSVRLRPFKALKKLFDLHRKKTCESSAKMNISNPNTNSAPLPWHVSLALLDPGWTPVGPHCRPQAHKALKDVLVSIFWHGPLCSCAICFLQLRNEPRNATECRGMLRNAGAEPHGTGGMLGCGMPPNATGCCGVLRNAEECRVALRPGAQHK